MADHEVVKVMRVFLLVKEQTSEKAILAVVPGKMEWDALVAADLGTQYVVDVVWYAAFLEEAALLTVDLATEDALVQVQDAEKQVVAAEH